MSNTTITTKKNVNVNAKNNKEEKKMAKDRIVKKNVITKAVEEVKTVPMSDAEFLAALEAQKPEVNFNPSAQPKGPIAQYDNLGRMDVEITNIEIITRKRAANEDTGEPAKFYKQLEITTNTTYPPCHINLNHILYKDGKKVDDVTIFDAKTDPSGTVGWYFTIKESSKDKKPEDITLAKDCVIHEIQSNERIWSPARKTEFKELSNILEVAELTFNGNKIEIPKNFTTALYIYEDMPKEDAKPRKIMKTNEKGESVTITKDPEPFYSVSFVPPCRQLNADKTQKYDDRFTTSKNIAHRKAIAELPNVVNYLASL